MGRSGVHIARIKKQFSALLPDCYPISSVLLPMARVSSRFALTLESPVTRLGSLPVEFERGEFYLLNA